MDPRSEDRLRLSIAEGSPDTLEQLGEWLKGEQALRGRVNAERRNPGRGQMGATLEALTLAVGAGGTISVLAGALTAWLSQPRQAKVIVTVETPNGSAVTVDADRVRVEEVESLLRRAMTSSGQAPIPNEP